MKFSIIVPVYNAEDSIERIIDAILNQSYKSWELILVNDGSTDGSQLICEKYQDEFNNIILINQANSGPSVARNTGLERATGDFCIFIDCDDAINNMMLEIISDKLTDNINTELLVFGYCDAILNDSEISILSEKSIDSTFCSNNTEFKNLYLKLEEKKLINPVWNKVYNRNFLCCNHIKFPQGIYCSEDFIFNTRIFLKVKYVRIIEECLYYYIHNSSSLTSTYKKEKFDNAEFVYDFSIKNLAVWNPSLRNSIHNYFLRSVNVYINSLYRSKYPISFFEKQKIVKDIINKKSINYCLKNVQCIGLRNKLFYCMLRFKLKNTILLAAKLTRFRYLFSKTNKK